MLRIIRILRLALDCDPPIAEVPADLLAAELASVEASRTRVIRAWRSARAAWRCAAIVDARRRT